MIENILWMLAIMVLTAWSCTGFVKNRSWPERKKFIKYAEIALICRFVIVYVIYSNGTDVSGTDGLLYHMVAKDVANQLVTGTPIWAVKYEYTWYTVLIGVQYAVLGVNRYAASFINAFLAILSGLFLTSICLNLNFSYKKSIFIGHAFMFMPSMMIWTTDTRKESMIFFSSILIWYLTLKLLKEREWSKKQRIFSVSAICLLLWISTLLRIHMLFTLGGGLLVCLFFSYLKTRRRSTLAFGAAVFAACLVITFSTVFINMRDYHAIPMDTSQMGDKNIDNEVKSIFQIIIEKDIPESINGFLTEPHLEAVANITDIAGYYSLVTIVRIEMVLWYLCMVVAVFGFLDAVIKWDPYLLGLIAYIGSYILINALMSENIADTYYRYRAAIVAPVLLFADYRPFVNHLKALFMEGFKKREPLDFR